MQMHIRLASPGRDGPLPAFALASSTQHSRLRVEHFPRGTERGNGSESPIQTTAGYADPMLDEAEEEDHASDATPDCVEDSDIYAGSESESSDSDEDEGEEEEFEEFEEEDMEMEMEMEV